MGSVPEYTPTTEQVREQYSDFAIDPDAASEEFDRWLTQHDAEVRAEAVHDG